MANTASIVTASIVAGITIGTMLRGNVQTPDYVAVRFEQNHYVVEAKPSPAAALVTQVQASEVAESPIQQLIREVFGEHAEDALKVAKCESGFNPNVVGDTHLLTNNGGDIVGDSIGVFQIRTGGKDFNRARANGMTPDEFRAEMKDPVKNIKYARTMFDREGWRPWTCKHTLKSE